MANPGRARFPKQRAPDAAKMRARDIAFDEVVREMDRLDRAIDDAQRRREPTHVIDRLRQQRRAIRLPPLRGF